MFAVDFTTLVVFLQILIFLDLSTRFFFILARSTDTMHRAITQILVYFRGAHYVDREGIVGRSHAT